MDTRSATGKDNGSGQPSRLHPSPPHRRLRIYAFDPSLDTQLDTAVVNRATVPIIWEDDLAPGPAGEYLEVIDYDPASGCFYPPVNLNDPYLLSSGGLEPSEGNPQFHQQMVYAVAMTTIRNFERALGRTAQWSARVVGKDQEEYVPRLRIYPHALRGANAYYSPAKKALLFGYFPATATRPGRHLPSGIVFTCLSHDVIAHETTHALLDGMHSRFLEPTNPDVLAFHEAFADIVALFQHFTFPEVLRHQLARTRGDLASQSLLGQLAQQFGEATGRYGALRDALGQVNAETGEWEPLQADPMALERVFEPHTRGSLLVAAVFDAFLSIYRTRVADLLRIASAGTGVLPAGELHPDLVNRLAREAARAAQHVLNMCIRALDYCPPADLTFGEYLRALITADFDLVPDDDLRYRVAFVEAFRRRGIYPRDLRTLSVDSLRWQPPERLFRNVPEAHKLLGVAKQIGDWDISKNREHIFEQAGKWRDELTRRLRRILTPESARELGLELRPRRRGATRPTVTAVRPARRIGPDGQTLTDVVIEVTQQRPERLSRQPTRPFVFRGGCTLVVDLRSGEVRYCIRKDFLSQGRLARQREFLVGGSSPSRQAVYFAGLGEEEEPFAFLHASFDEEGELR
jgi:hypothetical protein